MKYLSGKHISRRAMLKGAGAAISLPLLDAMIPAGRLWASTTAGKAADRTRLVCIEQVHGAAGCNDWGRSQNLWSPAETGKDFDLSPGNLKPLEPFRKYLTIVSDTDARMADAYAPAEIGGDHFRTSAVFLTQAHPKQTEGSDVRVGTSFDQLYVHRFGQDTPIPSMQLSIENVDQAGGCAYGYACVYTDTISWASPTDPLPMIRDPRAVFEQLFGAGGTAEQRAERLTTNRSILDWVMGEMSSMRRQLDPADVQRLDQYAQNIRELEQRIQRIEAQNVSGEERQIPEAPVGVPDSFEEHVKLMFDLQVLAFQSDTTRVFSLKLGRDASPRVYPESGVETPFHAASHHGGRPEARAAVRTHQRVPHLDAALLPREAAAGRRGRRHAPRQDDDHVRLGDGRQQPAQPHPLPSLHDRRRGRHSGGRAAHPRPPGHAHGQRHAEPAPQAGCRGHREVREQHGAFRDLASRGDS